MGSVNQPMQPLSAARSLQIFNVTMTLADTQYSQALPFGTKKVRITTDAAVTDNFRVAYVTGKVATPTAPYLKYLGTGEHKIEDIWFEDTTVYFACSTTGKIAQIEAWV